jgi:hypothetical protein
MTLMSIQRKITPTLHYSKVNCMFTGLDSLLEQEHDPHRCTSDIQYSRIRTTHVGDLFLVEIYRKISNFYLLC